jgi:hypothetical protein
MTERVPTASGDEQRGVMAASLLCGMERKHFSYILNLGH